MTFANSGVRHEIIFSHQTLDLFFSSIKQRLPCRLPTHDGIHNTTITCRCNADTLPQVLRRDWRNSNVFERSFRRLSRIFTATEFQRSVMRCMRAFYLSPMSRHVRVSRIDSHRFSLGNVSRAISVVGKDPR